MRCLDSGTCSNTHTTSTNIKDPCRCVSSLPGHHHHSSKGAPYPVNRSSECRLVNLIVRVTPRAHRHCHSLRAPLGLAHHPEFSPSHPSCSTNLPLLPATQTPLCDACLPGATHLQCCRVRWMHMGALLRSYRGKRARKACPTAEHCMRAIALCKDPSHLRPLDDDGVCGQVDPPCEGGGRDQHCDALVGKQVLHQGAVSTRHSWRGDRVFSLKTLVTFITLSDISCGQNIDKFENDNNKKCSNYK